MQNLHLFEASLSDTVSVYVLQSIRRRNHSNSSSQTTLMVMVTFKYRNNYDEDDVISDIIFKTFVFYSQLGTVFQSCLPPYNIK